MNRFFRAHGLGNDYLVWEGDPSEVTPEWVRAVCDRHTGVGSDGVLVPGAAPEHLHVDAPERLAPSVRIFNPDGSEAEKSGNGVRIFALWWSRKTGERAFVVRTLGGLVPVEIHGDERGTDKTGNTVRAEMGVALRAPEQQLCGHTTWPVDLGNPHRVLLTIPEDWRALGAQIEQAVPGRTNVQFVRVIDRGRVEARIWERGAGETTASGSSASAIARVVTALNLCDTPLVVAMPGGDLWVDVSAAGVVTIDGAIGAIGTFTLDPEWRYVAPDSAPFGD
jgi:diaminopimelate epimerase